MTDRIINIALVGVGGQGILLASEVISRAGMLAGLDVKKSEVHGMAQRGGSVVSQVRLGRTVFSPLIPHGEADYLMSFELVEALRHADVLSPQGVALLNRQIIVPVTVSSGQHVGVPDLDDRIPRAFPQHLLIDGMRLARELGNLRVVNMILTGALATLLPLDAGAWDQALRELVPERQREVNLRAFQAGREAAVPA